MTKTENPREMPVHPTLARIQAEWRLAGFEQLTGRTPRPEDAIVPSRRGAYRNVNASLRRFHEDLERIGLRARRGRRGGRHAAFRDARAGRRDHGRLHDAAVGSAVRRGREGPDQPERQKGLELPVPEGIGAEAQLVTESVTENVSRGNDLQKLAERTGLEPAASGVTGRRYNQLNYRSRVVRLSVGEAGFEPATTAL